MRDIDILEKLEKKLIVSCQALEHEPLYGSNIMAKLAVAAKEGGASAIRANTVKDIKEIKKSVDLPIIGIIKQVYEDSEIYITPTVKEIQALYDLGVDIIAVDFTDRVRPGGVSLREFVKVIKEKFPTQLFMADISTYEEGLLAEELGADIISTTLSGYTPYSEKAQGPDLKLLKRLSETVKIPVFCEGRVHYPEQAKAALENGAHAVVVGGAITRPLEITERFVQAIDGGND